MSKDATPEDTAAAIGCLALIIQAIVLGVLTWGFVTIVLWMTAR